MGNSPTRSCCDFRDFSEASRAELWDPRTQAPLQDCTPSSSVARALGNARRDRRARMIGLPPKAMAAAYAPSTSRPAKPSKTRSKLQSPTAARGEPKQKHPPPKATTVKSHRSSKS